MANKFSAMLGGVHRGTSYFEIHAGNVIDHISVESKRCGYECVVTTHHPVDVPHANERWCLITFSFKKDSVTTNASIQIYTDLKWSAYGVRSAQGFPPELGAAVLHVSTPTPGQENSSGVQALRKDDPLEVSRRSSLEKKPSGAVSTSSQIAGAVVSSIDLSTVIGFLNRKERTRQYIGASGIGESCMAYHALSLRGFPSDPPSAQLIRIFDAGNRIETVVARVLIAAGHKVEDVDPATGEQWEFTSHGGHHVCHLDGFITLAGSTERMTLEIKSMNRKMFESFQKKGVKLSHPHYYDQMIDGLQLAFAKGVEVEKAMLVAYCKDNSQYHAEIIEADTERERDIRSKVDAAVIMVTAVREGGSSYEYKCKQCFKRTSCWSPNVPTPTCVQCEYAVPSVRGSKLWNCSMTYPGPVPDSICPSFRLFRPSNKP